MNAATGHPVRRGAAVGLLGLGHGLGDYNAGVLLAALGVRGGADLVMLYVVYNALAFAGQPVAGLICDRVGGRLGCFTLGGCLSAAALAVAFWSPVGAVVCAGAASAFYHSAGGAAAWELGGRRALAAGVFAAPGVLGLALGLGFGANLGMVAWAAGGAALIVVLIAANLTGRTLLRAAPRTEAPPRFAVGLLGGLVGWIVILAIAARSFAWTLGQQAIFAPQDAVLVALAAAAGKCVAGFIADRFGAGRVTVIALAGAAGLLLLGQWWPALLFASVAALQAGTGPMMALVFRVWARHPAFASGLAQGLAVAIGGLPLLALGRGAAVSPWGMAGPLLAAAIAVAVVSRFRASPRASGSESAPDAPAQDVEFSSTPLNRRLSPAAKL